MNRAPAWLIEARRHIGLREIPGVKTSPTIRAWLENLRAWWRDDETPWCGVFAAHCMRTTGHALPKHYYRAKAWLDWGTYLPSPEVGCVVVFLRDGGGHVGFVVGRDLQKNLLVLGGNQGDAVSIAAFRPERAVGYRWPTDAMPPVAAALPLGAADLSRSEA